MIVYACCYIYFLKRECIVLGNLKILTKIASTTVAATLLFGSAPSANASFFVDVAARCVGNFAESITLALCRPLIEYVKSLRIFNFDAYFVLNSYCENMNDLAKKGKLHDCIGRDKEVNQLIDIISRSDKGNVCVTGTAGIGKTALVEGLAYRISVGNVPDEFKNKKIIKVNMVNLIAGDSYTGSDGAVSRIRSILGYAKDHQDIVLFIDEFHQIVKYNAAEVFKTYLESGAHVIAATTTAEYSYIARDPALERRFTQMVLGEPTKCQTLEMLKSLKKDWESENGVLISDEALSVATEYTGRYMRGRSYPDKAIDVVIRAARKVARNKKENEKDLMVNSDDIISVISEQVNIPLGKITDHEREILNSMPERVRNIIKGQDEAVGIFCDVVKKSRAGIDVKDRVQAGFLFAGTPGVGKTELAKVIGNEIGSLIRIDMSQNTSENALKKLFSSKIFGYKGELAEKLLKNPRSVVLFDNIEKAHPSVLQNIVNIVNNGYALNEDGSEVDFRNAFVVLNARISFGLEKSPEMQLIEKLGKNTVESMDKIIVFNKLTKEDYKHICKNIIDEEKHNLCSNNITLSVSDKVIEYLCNTEISSDLGAHYLEREIRHKISDVISRMIVDGKIFSGSEVLCDINNGKIEMEVK